MRLPHIRRTTWAAATTSISAAAITPACYASRLPTTACSRRRGGARGSLLFRLGSLAGLPAEPVKAESCEGFLDNPDEALIVTLPEWFTMASKASLNVPAAPTKPGRKPTTIDFG